MVEGMPFFNIATRYHVFFSHYFEFFGFYLWYTNANTHPFPSISIQVFNPSSFSSTDIHFHPYHLFVSSISSTVIHFHPSMVNGQWSSTVINFHPSLSIFILQSLKNNYGRILMAETRVRGAVWSRVKYWSVWHPAWLAGPAQLDH